MRQVDHAAPVFFGNFTFYLLNITPDHLGYKRSEVRLQMTEMGPTPLLFYVTGE
jgi:hypothetical protein